MGFSGRGKWETEEIVALSSYWVRKRLLAHLLYVTLRAELGLACQGDCGGGEASLSSEQSTDLA